MFFLYSDAVDFVGLILRCYVNYLLPSGCYLELRSIMGVYMVRPFIFRGFLLVKIGSVKYIFSFDGRCPFVILVTESRRVLWIIRSEPLAVSHRFSEVFRLLL